MNDNPVQPMSIADATNAVGQLVNMFRGLKRFDELLATCATLDQLTAEKKAAAEAARKDAETEIRLAEEARLTARQASDEANAKIQASMRDADRVVAECLDRMEKARAESDRVVAEESAASDRAQAEFEHAIAIKRDELSTVSAQLDEAKAALAAIKAKFG